MQAKILNSVEPYIDSQALSQAEPGIYHSYMACLATVLNHISGRIDPVRLMGNSAFAFRIFVNETLCPSAMSMFSFADVLPEAMEQAGYSCIYVSRMWDEAGQEEEKRQEAHQAIIEGIERGVPAVVWDVADAEWGLVIGFDEGGQTYCTLSHRGKRGTLPFQNLGRNGIDILSVAIPGDPNQRTQDEIVINALSAAVAHADGKEWIDDRPRYENGLAAFDLWAQVLDKWAWILNAGKRDNIGVNIESFARYYAGHYYCARCYARDYLKLVCGRNEYLEQAQSRYEKVAGFLQPLWSFFSARKSPTGIILKSFAKNLRDAQSAEKEGIELIRKHLSEIPKRSVS